MHWLLVLPGHFQLNGRAWDHSFFSAYFWGCILLCLLWHYSCEDLRYEQRSGIWEVCITHARCSTGVGCTGPRGRIWVAGLTGSSACLTAPAGLGRLQRKSGTVKSVLLLCIRFTPALRAVKKDWSLGRTRQYSGSIQACVWEES